MIGYINRQFSDTLKFCFITIFIFCSSLLKAQKSNVQSLIFNQSRDSVTIAANSSYLKASFLRKALMGRNYRKEWAEPVSMPLFNIKNQGFTPKEKGGGQQTTSLNMVDEKGRNWVLRSVDKKVKDVALPKNLRFPLAIKFLQEMISASHPYAAIPVGLLAQASGIAAPRPELYFVPDDPNLGEFRNFISNTICFLEQKEPTPDGSETEETDKVMEEIIEENDHLVLQEQVLKARLLDMFVADWDRHEGQWRWGSFKSGSEKYYYAIPRDRDQAFYQTDGLLPNFIKIFGMKHISNFKNKSKKLKNLNFKSWSFDKTFLNELDAATWEKGIKLFVASLPDSVIEKAIKKLPLEVYAINGKDLSRKLISRRNSLLQNAMKYYAFISGTVHVLGTAESELFEMSGNDNKLTVNVYRYKEQKRGNKIYERTFYPNETGIVYLNGLEGEDNFVIDEQTTTRIKLKINGGKGSDVYDLKGKMKTTVEDAMKDNNRLLQKGTAKIHFR